MAKELHLTLWKIEKYKLEKIIVEISGKNKLERHKIFGYKSVHSVNGSPGIDKIFMWFI